MPATFCNPSCHKCSWYFMTTTDFLVRTIYLLYVSFHVRIMLHHSVILLPHDHGFNKIKNYLKVLILHSIICNDYGLNFRCNMNEWPFVLYNGI